MLSGFIVIILQMTKLSFKSSICFSQAKNVPAAN